ncbi:MAG: hypothetical protein A2Z35_03410 [Actinobacteria bacterium RBG_19FT_COMBO_36_27]|nr:MAG: hypothetical protein A2Z35_03410 [Actinobacteria bacterium RBG_19FT_COMBO_36_27]
MGGGVGVDGRVGISWAYTQIIGLFTESKIAINNTTKIFLITNFIFFIYFLKIFYFFLFFA